MKTMGRAMSMKNASSDHLLKSCFAHINTYHDLAEKLEALESSVMGQIEQRPWLRSVYRSSSRSQRVVIASLIAIEQDALLQNPATVVGGWTLWKQMLQELEAVESFYAPIGGLVGYHREACKRLFSTRSPAAEEEIRYLQPPRIDISQEDIAVRQRVTHAAMHWNKIGLMVPLGGSGERLGLRDEQGNSLPVAFLNFEGKPLLQSLLEDIEAVELCIEQLTGQRYYTPIALMTSQDHDNHRLVTQWLAAHEYLGRPPASFFCFQQQRVPMMTKGGQWACEGPLKLMLRPGGHGAIWQGAYLAGVFDWFRDHQVTHTLMRQINNPLAGSDHHLLSLAGHALLSQKPIGFLSCPRRVGSSEGMNVLRVRTTPQGVHRCITNVEYVDLAREGIEDCGESVGSPYSVFSSNTNLFIVHLPTISELIRRVPFPAMVMNMKTCAQVYTHEGVKVAKIGRLESMMQNIADHLETSDDDPEHCPQFLLYAPRGKVISVTKKKGSRPGSGAGELETPESAFFDRQMMWHQLLRERSGMQLPEIGTLDSYYARTPPCVIHLHAALGPLHAWISERIILGSMTFGSYLKLMLAHLFMRNVYLDGACTIQSEPSKKAIAILDQVTIVNLGWAGVCPDQLWSGQAPSHGLKIAFEGAGLFIARGVTFKGNLEILVPRDKQVVACYSSAGELCLEISEMGVLPEETTQFIDRQRQWLSV